MQAYKLLVSREMKRLVTWNVTTKFWIDWWQNKLFKVYNYFKNELNKFINRESL